jgi:hypothetical protein
MTLRQKVASTLHPSSVLIICTSLQYADLGHVFGLFYRVKHAIKLIGISAVFSNCCWYALPFHFQSNRNTVSFEIDRKAISSRPVSQKAHWRKYFCNIQSLLPNHWSRTLKHSYFLSFLRCAMIFCHGTKFINDKIWLWWKVGENSMDWTNYFILPSF